MNEIDIAKKFFSQTPGRAGDRQRHGPRRERRRQKVQ
jgi:hypothetical protein